MNMVIEKRLNMLREEMARDGLDAFIFPSTDPHNGEYIPEHWEGRKWISGFCGSAGTAVVTMDAAALWTDSRYFIAAAQELEDTEYVLMKERIEGTPSISKWLGMKLADKRNPCVGVDGMVNSAASVRGLIDELRAEGGITVRHNFDPLERIWKDRPAVPKDKVRLQPLEFAGEACHEKIARIRLALRSVHADGMLSASLDDIAWTLNMRGSDVHCNPVFVAYLLIETKKVTLFIDKDKLSAEVVDYLKSEGVTIDDYKNVREGLGKYAEYNILVDSNEINYTLYNIAARGREIVDRPSPVAYMKAVKNEAEIEGFRNAMLRDGVAMVKFLCQLEKDVEAGGQTEISVSDTLERLRSEQDLYQGLSFDTISAYGEHGAIVHYEPTTETDVPLRKEGFLLLDSGAQYTDGTTDITRTIALGPLTDEMRLVYTLVLKGHIKLEMLKFPKGASGTQLDAVARMDMWREGMNYMHGTGHGVGSCLNVHEGPHQIRMEYKPAPMLAGMTVTDEPGLYLAGRFGVRIENTLLVVPYKETEFGEFLQFESLTLCPIDTAPVIVNMLSAEEKDWLNDYHRLVRERISPYLADTEKEWLEKATAAIW